VCDIASLGAYSFFNPQVYIGDGLHLSAYGNLPLADFLTATLAGQYSSLMNGTPMTVTQDYSIPWDWIQSPVIDPEFTSPATTNNGLTLQSSNSGTGANVFINFQDSASTSTTFGALGTTFDFSASNHAALLNPPAGTYYNESDVPAVPEIGSSATVSGSTSGTATFNQTMQVPGRKEVAIYCAALTGTASYTFPAAFTNTPVVLTTSGPATSVVTSLSTTAVTVTGSATTGPIFLEGW
jgi:hypothetical protein